MICATLLAVAVVVGAPSSVEPGGAESRFTGQGLGVFAGDSLSVMRDGQPVTVRLYGVACPPLDDELGLEAARHIYRLAVGRELSVTVVRQERNGRFAGVVRAGGRDLAAELIRAGLSAHRWAERPTMLLAEAQSLAQEEGRGIWSPTRGVVEVEVEPGPPPPPTPPRQSMTDISGGELTDQSVNQDDIVWIWSASSQPEAPDDSE